MRHSESLAILRLDTADRAVLRVAGDELLWYICDLA